MMGLFTRLKSSSYLSDMLVRIFQYTPIYADETDLSAWFTIISDF